MSKVHIVRDFLVAAFLIVIALFLIAYVRQDRQIENSTSDAVIEQDETGQTEDGMEQQTIVTTGVSGRVLVGPQCPVVREGEECPDKPFEGVVDLLVNDPERELIARVRTDSNGVFAATLPAGAYVVVVQHEGTFPVCLEEQITIESNSVENVTINCDSGIR